LERAYAKLIAIARTTWAQAEQVSRALRLRKQEQARRVHQRLLHFLPLVAQVIHQAVRRLFHRDTLPASAKVVSLFEAHTQILRRGKAPPRDTEFGHKVNYAEVEPGLISDWQVIAQGNPPDEQLLPALLRSHQKRFGQGPRLLAGDRGLFSPQNEQLAGRLGVKQICLPQPGPKTEQRRRQERQAWFKLGQRFRNGIEGRISVVRRTVQLARCPYQRLEGFERWIGWGVFVANLVVIARRQSKRRHRSKPP
jgi:transposase, IS5 family